MLLLLLLLCGSLNCLTDDGFDDDGTKGIGLMAIPFVTTFDSPEAAWVEVDSLAADACVNPCCDPF